MNQRTNDQTDIILEYLAEELTRLTNVVHKLIQERNETEDWRGPVFVGVTDLQSYTG
jgi:hypothetical protein